MTARYPTTAWLVPLDGPRRLSTIPLAPSRVIDGVLFTEHRGTWTGARVAGEHFLVGDTPLLRCELFDGDVLTARGTRYVFKTVA